MIQMNEQRIRQALKQAFQLGQDYWYQADHEYVSQNKKSDVTRAKFEQLIEDTVKEVLAQPEQRNLTEQEHDVLMNSIKASSTVVSKGFLAQPQQEQKCWCTTCHPITMSDMRFVVCPDCGNKRCPKANDHRHACTGSNEVGQKGSSWEHVKPMAYPEQECKSPEPKARRPDVHCPDKTCGFLGECRLGYKPEQEPVAWITEWEGKYSSGKILDYTAHTRGGKVEYTPLYTAPPQRKPPQFPTMLRKMWSGSEVQDWINENWNKGEA